VTTVSAQARRSHGWPRFWAKFIRPLASRNLQSKCGASLHTLGCILCGASLHTLGCILCGASLHTLGCILCGASLHTLGCILCGLLGAGRACAGWPAAARRTPRRGHRRWRASCPMASWHTGSQSPGLCALYPLPCACVCKQTPLSPANATTWLCVGAFLSGRVTK
jgi:hypothetical protein